VSSPPPPRSRQSDGGGGGGGGGDRDADGHGGKETPCERSSNVRYRRHSSKRSKLLTLACTTRPAASSSGRARLRRGCSCARPIRPADASPSLPPASHLDLRTPRSAGDTRLYTATFWPQTALHREETRCGPNRPRCYPLGAYRNPRCNRALLVMCAPHSLARPRQVQAARPSQTARE
jgi:hypothetical protein